MRSFEMSCVSSKLAFKCLNSFNYVNMSVNNFQVRITYSLTRPKFVSLAKCNFCTKLYTSYLTHNHRNAWLKYLHYERLPKGEFYMETESCFVPERTINSNVSLTIC